MNPPGREDLLLRIAAIVAIVLVLVLAYATVNLWTGVNQVPEINKQAVSPDTTGPVAPAITVCPHQTPAGNLTNAPEIAIDSRARSCSWRHRRFHGDYKPGSRGAAGTENIFCGICSLSQDSIRSGFSQPLRRGVRR